MMYTSQYDESSFECDSGSIDFLNDVYLERVLDDCDYSFVEDLDDVL